MIGLYFYGLGIINSSYGVFDYIEVLFSTISLIAIIEYVSSKTFLKHLNKETIFKSIVWKVYLPILLAFDILTTAYNISVLILANTEIKTIWAILIFATIEIVLSIPIYLVLYLQGYKVKKEAVPVPNKNEETNTNPQAV